MAAPHSRPPGLAVAWLATALALTCGLGSAPLCADDPAPPAPPVAPAPASTKPLPTPEQAADAVLAAIAAKDDAVLRKLAETVTPDPWQVADELLRRGEGDAAATFAKASARADTEALPTYVAAQRGRPYDGAAREAVEQARTLGPKGKAAEILALTEPLAPYAGAPVQRLLSASWRAGALKALQRGGQALEVYGAAAEAAEGVGWLALAAKLRDDAGHLAYASRLFPEARGAYERAAALHRRRHVVLSEAYSVSNLAGVLHAQGEHAEAIAHFERALPVLEANGKRKAAAITWANIGNVRRSQGEHALSAAAYNQALALHEALGDRAQVAYTLVGMASALKAAADNVAARAALERAVTIYTDLGDRPRLAEALFDLGGVLMLSEEFAAAQVTYERVRALHEAAGDTSGVAHANAMLGELLATQGDYEAGIKVIEQALRVLDGPGVGPSRMGLTDALAALGRCRHAIGDFVGALACYQRVRDMLQGEGPTVRLASVWTNLGNVQYALGDLSKARASHERALATQTALASRRGMAAAHASLGADLRALGEFAGALTHLERALALERQVGSKRRAAWVLASLGSLYAKVGDVSRARRSLEAAIAELEAVGNPEGLARALLSLADLLGRLEEPAEARALLERALSIEVALGSRSGQATVRAALGDLLVRTGEHAAASEHLVKALEGLEASGYRLGTTSVLVALAEARLAQGDLPAAREHCDRAVRAARSLRAAPLLVEALRVQAEVHLAEGDAGLALGVAQQALRETETLLGGLAEEEGAGARGRLADLYAVGTLAAAREGNLAETFAFLESGRAGTLLDALDRREVLRWKAESLPPELRAADEAAQTAERLARRGHDRAMESQDRDAQAQASRALDAAQDGVRGVQARIEREVKRAAGVYYPRARTLEDVEATLGPGEVLVVYGLCSKEALALVVTPDGARLVTLGERAPVEAACEALVLRKPDGEPTAALATVRALLIEPLGLDADVKTVLVSPEGPLCFLPWGALLDLPVAVTPSGTTHALLRSEEQPAGQGVLALGDPTYQGVSEGAQAVYYRGRVLAALPATRAEAKALGTTTLLGAEASEDGLRAALAKSAHWKAVHFACHGLIDTRRPTLSSLALSRAGEQDGFLTALEVLRMQIPADLAVLSACETGTGKLVGGEGIVGLTRSFMYAGSPRVICSLWKVDDEATAALMTKFYALWRPTDGTRGLPTAEALRAAQEHVRSQEKWKHPFYWAAWLLWGLPS